MKAFIFLTCLALSVSVHASRERKLYVGKDSTEAVLSFRGTVLLNAAGRVTEADAEEQIEKQLTHMFGPMGEAAIKAVPRGEHEISNIRISSAGARLHKIDYQYKGTIVLQKGPKTSYEFVLPANPDTIYSLGMVGGHNPCTDHHYQSEGDFWYFWNPANPGCPLKQGSDYLKIKGSIKRVANTRVSYPEYDRLVDENGQIVISLLMGMDDPYKNARDPNRSNDVNATNFRDIKNSLLRKQYKSRLWSESDIREVVKVRVSSSDLPYVEEFTKDIQRDGRKIRVVVRVFFGASGIDEESTAFHYFYKDALENASIMMYDGHSGLGGHLDIPAIERANRFTIQPNKNRYQIYFFNSCSSYTYYNTMYFGRKKSPADPKGTKNLDILTNGLATYFSVMHDTNLAVVDAVEAWASGKAAVSYQTLARQIDSDNLFGVNGDQDNVKPQKGRQ